MSMPKANQFDPPADRLKPPFNVPSFLGAIYQRGLKESKLLAFYELNKQDFIDAVALAYFDHVNDDPDSGSLTDLQKGFGSFCALLTEHFLGAPPTTNRRSVD